MKKILIAVIAVLSLAQLNALTLDEVLENKTLVKEIQETLQKNLEAQRAPYTVVGLLYTGEATLVNHYNDQHFSLEQNKGYITYSLRADNSFDTFSLEVTEDENNSNPDPHRTNVYNVLLKLFKGKIPVQERLAGVIELRNAGIANEGSFYTNLAVNATYGNKRFYILDKEPDTCGKQIDLTTSQAPKPAYKVNTVVEHDPDCKDPYHCSCPAKTVIERQEVAPAKVSFTVQTETCKRDKTCKCPEYIISQN